MYIIDEMWTYSDGLVYEWNYIIQHGNQFPVTAVITEEAEYPINTQNYHSTP